MRNIAPREVKSQTSCLWKGRWLAQGLGHPNTWISTKSFWSGKIDDFARAEVFSESTRKKGRGTSCWAWKSLENSVRSELPREVLLVHSPFALCVQFWGDYRIVIVVVAVITSIIISPSPSSSLPRSIFSLAPLFASLSLRATQYSRNGVVSQLLRDKVGVLGEVVLCAAVAFGRHRHREVVSAANNYVILCFKLSGFFVFKIIITSFRHNSPILILVFPRTIQIKWESSSLYWFKLHLHTNH